MLHETAVAWLRSRLAVTTPARSWEETPSAHGTRIRACCSYINGHYDVAGLCRDFPRRVRDLVDKKGERLKE